ncbi:TonB-dependent receptor [Alishewanella tabrizica]|uniref:Oar protein n=1 Tax=Alishewanella tabrizica TaxID=671278 RepID=A0ABQ2WFT9_9ALTE|nr:TonB-dependent receptor [Alishewanella tabrizica]GGW54193.1 Oar protein [Alishewanella tabrizica]
MKIKHLAMAVTLALGVSNIAFADTASSIRGNVVTAQGQAAANARVEILHLPSNTRSSATTNESGAFVSSGLRVGGPYRISIISEQGTREFDNVYLSLGETFRLNAELESSSIERIAVTGSSISFLNAGKMGTSTTYNAADINSMPLFERDLKDVIKQDPLVVVLGDNNSSMTVAGANPRYNSLTVDGVRQDDDFGLNDNGYPTQRSPIPMSALDQITVSTAPFTVKSGGFTGAGINAVTKSGTNELSGSFFYEYMDDSLSGKSGAPGRDKVGLNDFERTVWGVSLGGAIIQDKLFFFAAYEDFTEPYNTLRGPQGSNAANSASVTQADIDTVVRLARDLYGVDAGQWDINDDLEDKKLLAKLDWNINDSHRFSFTYQNTKSNAISAGAGSNARQISLDTNFYKNQQDLVAYAGHLYSDWSDSFSTEIKVSWKDVEVGQDPLRGNTYGQVQVDMPSGRVVFGPDTFRHANELTNDLFQFRLAGEYLLNDHTISFGWEHEKLDVYNLFVPNSKGTWQFHNTISNGVITVNGFDRFQQKASTGFSYQNAFTLNPQDAAAAFKLGTDALFLQDSWDLFDYDLRLDFGLRYERYSSDSVPRLNTNFQQRYGIVNTENMDGKDLLMPRFGFNWSGLDNTVIRGGLGRFGGGRPNVWIANSFSNDGVILVQAPGSATANQVNVDFANVPDSVKQSLNPGDGNVNAVDPNFKLPSEWKYNLAVDYLLESGYGNWDLTAEYIHSNKDRDVIWKDLHRENFQIVKGPDGRNIYTGVLASGVPNRNDILFVNGDGGRSNIYALGAATKFDNLSLRFGYAHQNVKDLSSGTSAQAASNFSRYAAIDRNTSTVGTAGFEIKHRFNFTMIYSQEFFAGYDSTFTLYGERRSGRPYSWTVGPGSAFGDNNSNGGSDDRNGYLPYIPTGPNDTNVRYNGSFGWDNFVAAGLDKYAGQIMPRNTESGRYTNSLDFKFEQQVPGFMEGHKGSVYLEIKNLLNLLDSSAGRAWETEFPSYQRIANVSYDAANNQYVYSAPTARTTEPQAFRNIESAWRIKIGVSYKF